MRVEVIPQIEIGNVSRIRIGDILNDTIASSDYNKFRFAVAYMRVSGIDRLSVSIESLLNRNGYVAGAVGIDDGVTSVEALEMLQNISSKSTIFHTISGFIYHPKLYLVEGEQSAVAVVGSGNLTRDGLFRNVELATAIFLDFASNEDYAVYQSYDSFLNQLLDTTNPNVQLLNTPLIQRLLLANVIQCEAQTEEPGPSIRSRRTRQRPTMDLAELFPYLRVPVAPPTRRVATRPRAPRVVAPVVITPVTVDITSTFIMQLSAFDSSHRTGVTGTTEVLIPHAAINFFPPISLSGRKYPDVYFNIVLNTPEGRERHSYRFWYYEERAKGTRIDEYRLRLDRETIDLSTLGGGDLLVISKLPEGSDPAYEVTILPQTDPTFLAFLAQCTNMVQDKRWGMV